MDSRLFILLMVLLFLLGITTIAIQIQVNQLKKKISMLGGSQNNIP